MNFDFSKPQRQSAVGIIMMTADAIRHTVKALFVPLAVALIKLDKEFLSYFGLGVAVLLVVIAIFAYFSYRRFTFYLDEDKQEFVINKGVFNRTQLTVQLDKIQQVNINQNLLQKIIGIYGLEIDTAGAEGQEVSIKAIHQNLAHSLREHLLSRKSLKHTESHATVEVEEDIPFLKVSAKTLLKVGLTSNYAGSIALLLAFLYPLYHTTKELLNALNMDKGQVENALSNIFSFFPMSILIVAILLLILSINIIRTFVKYFDFHISKHRHALLITSGLFAKKNTLLSPNKVQVTTYSQNYFQRKMNLLNMNLKQADAGVPNDPKDLESSNLEIPGCNLRERDTIMVMILGQTPPQSTIFLPNWRFLNLPIFFKVVLPLVLYLILCANYSILQPYYPLAIVYFMLATTMIYFSYKRHHLRVDQDFIVKRSGIWDIKHEVLFPHKIQAITTFQYPWHKGVDVGHINLHTAAGTVHFKYGNYTEIKKLADYWLYQIESGSEEWM